MRSRSAFFISLAFASTIITLLSSPVSAKANDKTSLIGAHYESAPSTYIDFSDVSTLSDFNRMVYRYRWKEIEAEDVIAELQKFKGASNSPAMREIWRDILLSDFAGIKASKEEQVALMAERLRLLNRLGYFDEAVRLYQQAAVKKPIAEAVATQGIESLALSGSADGACLEVMMASQYLTGESWDRDATLCAAYFGDSKKAEALYEKAAVKAGSGFKAVYKMLNKGENKAIHVGIPALWRTLLLAQGATVTADALKDADAMTLSSLSINKKVPLGVRISAALRAADHSTIGSDRLRKLYETKYPEDKGLQAATATALSGGTLAQPEYYSVARFNFEGVSRAKIVTNAINHLNIPTNVKSQVYGWIVDKLTLQQGDRLKFFARDGFGLMVATNRIASANYYYKVGKLENSPMEIIHALLEGKPWSAESYKTWEKAMQRSYQKNADTKISRLFRTVKAYDQEQKLALATIQPKTLNDETKGKTSLLQNSLRNGGKGLSLITALNVLSAEKSIGQTKTDDFVDIISVLTQQGLFAERKKLTLEFLLQNVL